MKENKKNATDDDDLTPWDRFQSAMRLIVNVPHSEIKAYLDAETKVRSRKRTRKSKYAAFRAGNKTD
jgi:hypothetical protein